MYYKTKDNISLILEYFGFDCKQYEKFLADRDARFYLKCSSCESQISGSLNQTGNWISHVKRKHKHVYHEYLKKTRDSKRPPLIFSFFHYNKEHETQEKYKSIRIKCKFCTSKISGCVAVTSNFVRHLKIHHKKEYEIFDASKNNLEILPSLASQIKERNEKLRRSRKREYRKRTIVTELLTGKKVQQSKRHITHSKKNILNKNDDDLISSNDEDSKKQSEDDKYSGSIHEESNDSYSNEEVILSESSEYTNEKRHIVVTGDETNEFGSENGVVDGFPNKDLSMSNFSDLSDAFLAENSENEDCVNEEAYQMMISNEDNTIASQKPFDLRNYYLMQQQKKEMQLELKAYEELVDKKQAEINNLYCKVAKANNEKERMQADLNKFKDILNQLQTDRNELINKLHEYSELNKKLIDENRILNDSLKRG